MRKNDLSTWLTKQQAAEAIGVTTKSIERFAAAGDLHQGIYSRPGGGPAVAVYHPDDVERIRKQRNPDAEPFVLPASAASMNQTVAVRQPNPEEFLQALSAMSQTSQTRPQLRLSEKLYLTITEAGAYTGLGVGYLRKLVDNGTLSPLKGAGPRGASVFRRADLEKL